MFATWHEGLAALPVNAVLSAEDFDHLLQIRDATSAGMELLRAEGTIGASLQADVAVYADDAFRRRYASVADELRFFFITSSFALKPETDKPLGEPPAGHRFVTTELHAKSLIDVGASEHPKCVRCWHYRADVGSHPDDPELCDRCVDNVNGVGESRRYF
jgi:isoleucyl-tRNA synthetase